MAQKRTQLETTLAYMAVGTISVSILAILTTLLLALFEVENITPLVVQLPLVGLPIGFLLIIALLITSVIRNRRENRS